jgi:hypothetical protein
MAASSASVTPREASASALAGWPVPSTLRTAMP